MVPCKLGRCLAAHERSFSWAIKNKILSKYLSLLFFFRNLKKTVFLRKTRVVLRPWHQEVTAIRKPTVSACSPLLLCCCWRYWSVHLQKGKGSGADPFYTFYQPAEREKEGERSKKEQGNSGWWGCQGRRLDYCGFGRRRRWSYPTWGPRDTPKWVMAKTNRV